LSPAGTFAALVAAVSNGADAVYLGSKLFNARRLAGNFNNEELKKAFQYAHLHHVKVFLTLNTLIKNQEINAFLNQVSIAEHYGVDALILQDLTFAPLIKSYFPRMQIHASTQATIMNSAAVHYWQKDVDVFILARELTKQQVREIYDNTQAHLEVFVHGHLCISYSGQCLISSLIGKRSGNRGLCASSCRKQYNGDSYLLSAKDLCMIKNVKDVLESGARTIKIEGRMKSPEYAATATRLYRRQLDYYYNLKKVKVTDEDINDLKLTFNREVTDEDINDLKLTFNREVTDEDINDLKLTFNREVTDEDINDLKLTFNREFTSGYFNHETKIVDPVIPSKRGIFLGQVQNGYLELKENIELFDGLSCVYKGKKEGDFVKKIVTLQGREIIKAEKGMTVKLFIPGFIPGAQVYLLSQHQGKNLLGENKKVKISLKLEIKETEVPKITITVKDKKIIYLLNSPASKALKHPLAESDLKQQLEKFRSDIFLLQNIEVSTDCSFIPKSELTLFRKELDSLLLDELAPITSEQKKIEPPLFKASAGTKRILQVRVYSKEDALLAVKAGADVIYYDALAADAAEAAAEIKGKAAFFLYTPMALTDTEVQHLQQIVTKIKPNGLMANNVGVLELEFAGEIILGPQMNIFNGQQLAVYGHPAVASLELNLTELAAFVQKEKLIYYAHGRPVVMTFKEEFNTSLLTDKKGYTFPLRKTNHSTEMLYSKTLALLQHTQRLLDAGITQLYLDLEKDVFQIVDYYKKVLQGKNPSAGKLKRNATIGNLAKGVM